VLCHRLLDVGRCLPRPLKAAAGSARASSYVVD
jgi:hypothetical protein